MTEGFNIEEFLKKVAGDFSAVIRGKVLRIGNVSRKTPQGTIVGWSDCEEKRTDAEETEEERIIREEKEGKLYIIEQTEAFLSGLPEKLQEYEEMTEKEEVKNKIEEQVRDFLKELFLEINEAEEKSEAYQAGANMALSMVGGYLFLEPKKWED